MVVAIAIAFVVDRFVIGRGARVRRPRLRERDVPAAQTRLRLIRRLVFVVILLIGAALALSQFDKLEKLATGLLASSALIGLVAGLRRAARCSPTRSPASCSPITQPIRIGDSVEIEEVTGRVDDMTLAAHLHRPRRRAADGRPEREGGLERHLQPLDRRPQRPGERLGLGARRTPTSPRRGRRSRTSRSSSIEVAEITAEGVRVEVHGASDPARTVIGGEEAVLRERSHEALLAGGVARATAVTCKSRSGAPSLPFSAADDSAGTQKAAALPGVAG